LKKNFDKFVNFFTNYEMVSHDFSIYVAHHRITIGLHMLWWVTDCSGRW